MTRRKMKDSGVAWIGPVPEGWNRSRLKNHVVITTGNLDTQDANPDGEYPFYVRSPIVERSDAYTFQGPGILMAGDGAGAGRVFHLAQGRYAVHQRVYRLFDFRDIDVVFLWRYLSEMFPRVMDMGSAQSTVPSVRMPMLTNLRMFLPPLPEQRKIAAFLDGECGKIDVLRGKVEEQIAALEEYRKSVITEAVTKGIKRGRKMKPSGIEWVGEINADWHVVPNKYLMHKSKCICTKWSGENIVSLTMNGVVIRDIENPVGKMPASFDGYQYVETGDLLMCLFDYDVTPRTVGRCRVGGVTSPAYSRYKVNRQFLDLDYVYYYYLMVDDRKAILHRARNLRHSFSDEEFGLLKMPVPSLAEQREIAAYLDKKCAAIDSMVAKCREELDRLAEYKKSLIYEYVTGKKEVA